MAGERKMDPDASRLRILSGYLYNLPPLVSHLVRIFISSTFTDTREERNLLMAEVYPKLKEHCRQKYNLEFQVVDMRWGVRDHALDDHATTQLCLQEIRSCLNLSTGPAFVTFLGQRYGSRPFPATIPASHFYDLLRHVPPGDSAAGELLGRWFREDTNAHPPVCVLQPVSTYIPDFLAKDPERKSRAQQEWQIVLSIITDTLRHAATLSTTLTEAEKQRYFMSVTELEIEEGLLGAPQPHTQCLCYIRLFNDLDLEHPLAWRFMDVSGKAADEDAQSRMQRLREEKVAKSLTQENIRRDTVHWSAEGGVHPAAHKAYLDTLGEHFYSSVMKLVERAVATRSRLSDDQVYSEALQHLQLAHDRCAIFRGRQEVLVKVKDIIARDSNKPITLYGHSGCGKTSLMAKIVQTVRTWIPDPKSTTVVCRFLGTSPKSSGIHQTLSSLCQQLVELYKLFPEEEVPDGFSEMSLYFVRILNAIPMNKTLVLVLDSLDQLTAQNYAHKLAWIPQSVPSNVIVVVSTLPTMYGILDVLREKYGEGNLVRVPNLQDDLCMDILKMWLDNEKRSLTEEQMQKVQEAFAQCSLPLYVRLVTEEVLRWRSYDPPASCVLRHTIKEVIQELLHWLETKHGEVIVTHALAYISASKQGLGETELEDLLSLDDVVLTDVYQYHLPPTRRIPPLLWVRIRHDISSYLVTREADGLQVAFWYHRQFIETARERYLSNPAVARNTHESMAEYYDGRWHNTKKAFQYTQAQAAKLKLKSVESEADRKVMEQPLCFSDGVYNTRKLNCLPYHLASSGDKRQLKAKCLFNYTWLLTKLKACGVHSILRDIDLIAPDKECNLLRSCINLIKSTIYQFPESLSVELAGRLMAYSDDSLPNIQELVKQTCRDGLADNVLFPRGQLFEGPGGPLKYTLEDKHMQVHEKLVCLGPGSHNLLVVNEINELIMWDLTTGEVEKQFPLPADPSQVLNVLKVQRTTDRVHSFQAFAFNTKSNEQSKETVLMILACAFQKASNPVVVVDAETGNVLHSVSLDVVYSTIGFKDNLLIDLVGNHLIWHIRGKTVDIFDILTGRQLKSLDTEAKETKVLSSRQLLLVQLRDGKTLHLYNTKTWSKLATMELESVPDHLIPFTNSPECLMVYLKQQQLQVVNADQDLKLIGTSSLAKHLPRDVKNAHVVKFQDDSFLAICCTSCFVVWNLKSNTPVHTFSIPGKLEPNFKVQATVGCFYPDKSMFVGGYAQYMIFCDLNTGNIAKTLSAASAKTVMDLMVSDDSKLIISVIEKTKILKVWDMSKSSRTLYAPLTLSAPIRYMESAARVPRVAVRTYHATESCVIDATQCRVLAYQSPNLAVMTPSITHDGNYAVLRSPGILGPQRSPLKKVSHEATEKVLKVWSADTGRLVSDIPVSSLSLKICCSSPDSKYIATQCETSPTEDFRLAIWDLKTGKHIRDMAATEGGVSFMYFTGNSKYLATLQQYPLTGNGMECVVHIYATNSGREVFTQQHVAKDSLQLLPPDDRVILFISAGKGSGSEAFMVFLDSSQNFNVIKTLPIAPRGRLSLSRDGLRASDKALNVYDLVTGAKLCQFTQTHESQIGRNPYTWPRITSEGTFLVWLVRTEGRLYVGEVSSGMVVGGCFLHSTPLSLVVLSDDTVGVGTDEGHLMLLNIVTDTSTHQDVYTTSRSLVKSIGGIGLMLNKSSSRGTTKSKTCTVL